MMLYIKINQLLNHELKMSTLMKINGIYIV